MAITRAKAKGRRNEHTFAGLPHAVLKTQKYASLSGWAVKLLVDITNQFDGSNNGDLQASWTCMRKVGWRSKGTLYGAAGELLDVGFILKTRQGGRNQCSLYAITWKPIDHCPDKRTKHHKLDVDPTRTAPGTWRDDQPWKQAA